MKKQALCLILTLGSLIGFAAAQTPPTPIIICPPFKGTFTHGQIINNIGTTQTYVVSITNGHSLDIDTASDSSYHFVIGSPKNAPICEGNNGTTTVQYFFELIPPSPLSTKTQ
jgi:hypothetical protein